jgi:Tol biopolymer transport system component
MPLSAGTRLGPYEIIAPIGAGGMGEVYRARDPRMGRDVAIKLSADRFSDRFEREVRAVAALNHPNICHIYDVGPNYLVMELVEGPTLAERLKAGAIPLEEALTIARQIGDALEAAHEKGIVHRDLKPANIKIAPEGAVKVLDFGLAKIADAAAPASGNPDDSPTVAMGATIAGQIMGTAAYMSPEQARGKTVDKRADIWAFGVVLYEMLTARRLFEGETISDTLAGVLTKEPDWRGVPGKVQRLLRTCLEKNPKQRLRDIGDAWRLLDDAPAVSVTGSYSWKLAAGVLAATAIAILLFLAFRPKPAPLAAEVVRLSLNPPDNASFTGPRIATVAVPQFALSPDGRSIVFVAATADAKPTLWLRPLPADLARAMPGTEGADGPFWSPDSRWIGFFADGKLKKIPAAGGPVLAIADVPDPRGGSWGPNETILFGTGFEGISQVSASGGTPQRLTEPDLSRQEGSHRNPEFLPDGKHFLFTVRSGHPEQTGVYAGSLDRRTKKLLIHGSTNVLYASSGHLLFMDGDTLMGQAFDAEHIQLRGEAFIVEGHVGLSSIPAGAFSISAAGILAHAKTLSEIGRLTWFDRGGNPSDSVGPAGDYLDFRLSPDQTRLAASMIDVKTGAPDIWLTDLTVGNPVPFTFAGFFNAEPTWSPDSARIIFRTWRSGAFAEFYSKSAGGGGNEEPVLLNETIRVSGARTNSLIPCDWSPDGRFLLYFMLGSDSGLWLLPLADDRKPVKFLSAPGDQLHGNFSPEGKLVAYSSNESGRFEVHVQTFPLSDRKWIVSTAGGSMPRWRADGRELYYLSLDSKLMSVPVGPGPSFGAPRPLFQTRVPRNPNLYRTHYVPSRDGQRFLVNTLLADLPPVSITVMLNWSAGLRK